jgi:hypothetical protein
MLSFCGGRLNCLAFLRNSKRGSFFNDEGTEWCFVVRNKKWGVVLCIGSRVSMLYLVRLVELTA